MNKLVRATRVLVRHCCSVHTANTAMLVGVKSMADESENLQYSRRCNPAEEPLSTYALGVWDGRSDLLMLSLNNSKLRKPVAAAY